MLGLTSPLNISRVIKRILNQTQQDSVHWYTIHVHLFVWWDWHTHTHARERTHDPARTHAPSHPQPSPLSLSNLKFGCLGVKFQNCRKWTEDGQLKIRGAHQEQNPASLTFQGKIWDRDLENIVLNSFVTGSVNDYMCWKLVYVFWQTWFAGGSILFS